MKSILLFTLLVTVKTQTQDPSPSPTLTKTPTPTTTPMGSPMFTYSLKFPNSDPAAAMRADRLAYLIKAIACSANVPVELVYISYVRADYKYVAFKQETHTITGLVQNCATLSISSTSLRGLQFVVSTSSNALLEIYYLAPRSANPVDPLFQVYASAVLASASASASGSGNFTDSFQGQGQNTNGISGGGIAGLVIGILASLALATLTLVYYVKRRRVTPVQTQTKIQTDIHPVKRLTFNPQQTQANQKPNQVKKVTLPTVTVR